MTIAGTAAFSEIPAYSQLLSRSLAGVGLVNPRNYNLTVSLSDFQSDSLCQQFHLRALRASQCGSSDIFSLTLFAAKIVTAAVYWGLHPELTIRRQITRNG